MTSIATFVLNAFEYLLVLPMFLLFLLLQRYELFPNHKQLSKFWGVIYFDIFVLFADAEAGEDGS